MLPWNLGVHGVISSHSPLKPVMSLPSGLLVLMLIMHGQYGTPLLLLDSYILMLVNLGMVALLLSMVHVYHTVSGPMQRLR
ncbi:MAG: hypothetical protein ETSY2_46345 [Candidatus Entotheonella gemina]|uniref:Uncharacterized protein n=1 Tax=Candidatus Entotheonella gemina TaxID=1429439 RepID=W4LEE2_9BACT|nr:MAG: hypothetical protein ETSY2_46345 [Candidatus Entotheonella gemina]